MMGDGSEKSCERSVAVTRGWSRVTPSNPGFGLRIFFLNSFADFSNASGGFFPRDCFLIRVVSAGFFNC